MVKYLLGQARITGGEERAKAWAVAQVSTRILGRRTAPFPRLSLFLTAPRVALPNILVLTLSSLSQEDGAGGPTEGAPGLAQVLALPAGVLSCAGALLSFLSQFGLECALHASAAGFRAFVAERRMARRPPNTNWYSSTYLATGFANGRAGTQKRRGVFGYPPEH